MVCTEMNAEAMNVWGEAMPIDVSKLEPVGEFGSKA